MTTIMDLSFSGQWTATATLCISHDSVCMPGPHAGKSDTWHQIFQNDSNICEAEVTLTPLISKICKPSFQSSSLQPCHFRGIFVFCFWLLSLGTRANFFRSSWERASGVTSEFEMNRMQGLVKAISLLFCFNPKTSSCHAGSNFLDARS